MRLGFYFLAILLLFAACKSRTPSAQPFASSSVDTAFVPDASKTPFEGELRFAAKWVDAGGQQVFILSGKLTEEGENPEATLYARAYRANGKGFSCTWNHRESVQGLGCDLRIDLPRHRIHIQDLDADGYAEILFCYTLDHRCDAVPVDARLVYLLHGKAAWIHGQAMQFLGPPQSVINERAKESGTAPYLLTAPDIAMKALPEKLRSFAMQVWEAWVMEE